MTKLLPCPLCHSADVRSGVCYVEGSNERQPAACCAACGCRATEKAWNGRTVVAATPTPGMCEALTRRVLDAWRIRFPNNAYAWPAVSEEFASSAVKVVMACYQSDEATAMSRPEPAATPASDASATQAMLEPRRAEQEHRRYLDASRRADTYRKERDMWKGAAEAEAAIGKELLARAEKAEAACPVSRPEPAATPVSQWRDQIAAFLLARDEDYAATPNLLAWAERLIAQGRDAQHDGDCTKKSYTCLRCTADRALADADRVIALAAAPQAQDVRCDKCGSSGDVFVLCAGCHNPVSRPMRAPE